MINRILFILSSLLLSAFANAATGQSAVDDTAIITDTLTTARSAKELCIETCKSEVRITVKRLNGTEDNFYYTATSPGKKWSFDYISSVFKDIQDLEVVEIEGRKVQINFLNAERSANTLSYDIPSPENHETTCYTATRHLDFGITLGKKGKSQWSLVSMGLGLGFVTPLNDIPELDTSMGRSLEFSWLMVLGARWRQGRNSISFGLGIDTKNYLMNNGRYFRKQTDGTIILPSFDDGESEHSSRLYTFSLQIPVLYTLRFGRNNNCGFTLGPIINFNTYGSLNTNYRIGDEKYDITTRRIGQRPVTVDLLGAIHWNSIGIYARYAPLNVLKSKTGLDFQSFSTGIMIML